MRIYDKSAFDQVNVFGLGQANTAYAQYFIGSSYLNPLTEAGKCPVFLANVTFEPAVGTTGTSTAPRAAEASCSSAPPERAGTRRRARRP